MTAFDPTTMRPDAPAFPSHGTMGEVVQEGMSMRDYFAAKALAALIVGRSWDMPEGGDAALIKQWASSAYLVADAMLAARGDAL